MDGGMNNNLPDSTAAILTEDGVRHLLFAEEVQEGDDGLFDCGGTHLSLEREYSTYIYSSNTKSSRQGSRKYGGIKVVKKICSSKARIL